MGQVLLYGDDQALAAYLGGAAAVIPDLTKTKVDALALAPRKGSDLGRALVFAQDDPALPAPSEDSRAVALARGTFDRGTGVLTVAGRGKAAQALKVTGPIPSAARELGRALPPVPWRKAPDDPAVLFLVHPGPVLAQVLAEHLELGHDDLRYASVAAERGGDSWVAIEVERPSWFVLERWLGRDPARAGAPPQEGDVRIYRRVGGPLGGRRVCVAWGLEHVLEPWLVDPKDEKALLLIDASGEHRVLDRGAFKDVGELLDLDPTRFSATRLESTADPGRISIALRLEGRAVPRDPELWLLPWADRERLEALLAGTPEDELRNLLVACVARPDGTRVLAVREALTGRAPRLLPLGKQAFAPVPGLPSLLVPCDRVLAPPLATDRYARAFGARPGELTVVDLVPGTEARNAKLVLQRIDERLFRPIETIVDFVVDGEATRLADVVLAAPFDLGPFAEEDLLPANAPARERREKRERPEAAPREAEAEAKDERPRVVARPKAATPQRTPAPDLSRQPPDARRERAARLERQLALEKATPELWLELGRLRLADADVEEALRSYEHALWDLPGPAAAPVVQELLAALPAPAAGHADPAGPWRSALTFPADLDRAKSGAQALTERVYKALHDGSGRLRKRGRWLLWRSVLDAALDPIEGERQREDILSELVLRGVEEHEVPPFVRQTLLEHHGRRAAQGAGPGGTPEALQLLERARRVAQDFKVAPVRAEALAHVAWALAELGDGARALDCARAAREQAEAGATAEGGRGAARESVQHRAFRARALCRVGAVLERSQGRGRGQELLERSLAALTALSTGEARDQTEGDRGLASWLACLADLRGASAGDDKLLERALTAISERPAEKQALLLSSVAKDLVRLGAAAHGARLARALLAQPRLALAPRQDAVTALEAVLGEQQPPTAEDADRIDQALTAATGAQDIDEFALPMMQLSMRARGARAWEAAERLHAVFQGRGQRYAARLVRLAGLRCLADQRDRRTEGAAHLAAALNDAWTHEDTVAAEPKGQERMRLVVRLAALVPAFGLRDKGLELLTDVRKRAASEPSLFLRNELLLAAVLAASKLGEAKASFDLVDALTTTAIETFKAGPSRQGEARWLMFETLESCADGAVELGDTRRGLTLVQRIADSARTALDQAGTADAEGRYFYCRALIRAGRAMLALGAAPLAEKAFEQAFTKMRQFRQLDLIDTLGLAAETAGQLDGAPRYQLARQVLDGASASGATGELFDRAQIEQVMARLARDMVQGESAYAAALKRWRGREERSIRDRVATEAIGKR